jgi:tetrahedral aminopeptidase
MNNGLLKRIASSSGVSGFEDAVQDVVARELADCCDEVWRDHLGNVFALKRAESWAANGRRPIRLMIAAHADEVGMMVKHVNPKGYIHFIQMGGINPVVAQSQRVVIHGRKPLRGVIAPRSNDDSKEACKLDDLLIDTGLSKSELDELVSPGDIITFEGDASVLNDKVWVGRNFDNRIGTYCLVEAMRQVGPTTADVYAVSTTQEEVGLRGARAASFAVAPDIGVAIDGSMAGMAYVPDHEYLCELGKGTGIYVVDKLTIGHPQLVRYMLELCAERRIACQRNIGGATDASAMQQSRAGVIATTIGAPVRYMHSTVQLCHADDMDATVDLLVAMMQTANRFYEQLVRMDRAPLLDEVPEAAPNPVDGTPHRALERWPTTI